MSRRSLRTQLTLLYAIPFAVTGAVLVTMSNLYGYGRPSGPMTRAPIGAEYLVPK